jgi:hypothetical protein
MEITSAPYFRITGGAVWIAPGTSTHLPLLRYVAGSWEHGDVLWSGMRFEGKCRLIFGLPRDPAGVSDEIDSLSIYGNTLSANGIPFALYNDDREMWQGVEANSWWHAFRVESAEIRVTTGTAGEHAEDAQFEPSRHLQQSQHCQPPPQEPQQPRGPLEPQDPPEDRDQS